MWESLDSVGDEYRLSVRATRVSMRQLVLLIVGCVVIGGAAAIAIMIAFTLDTGITLVRPAVAAVSGALGVFVVLALLWVFSWRRKSYVVDWNTSGVRLTGAGHDVVFPWDSIEKVLVRTDTDYARVELRKTDGTSATLLAGFGSQDVKKPHAIDQIPDGVVALLRRHQFVERTRERNARGLHLFVRDAG